MLHGSLEETSRSSHWLGCTLFFEMWPNFGLIHLIWSLSGKTSKRQHIVLPLHQPRGDMQPQLRPLARMLSLQYRPPPRPLCM